MSRHKMRRANTLPGVFWRILNAVFCTLIYGKTNSSSSKQIPLKNNPCAVSTTSLPFNWKSV